MIIVDSSVAVKWVVAEERREEARLILTSGFILNAPDFLMLEAASALRKKVRRNEIAVEQVIAGIDVIKQAATLLSTRLYVDDAIALSSALDHSVYDCCFLACAEQEGGLLVTDDDVFLRKCRDHNHATHVAALADVGNGGLDEALQRLPSFDPFSRSEIN